MKFISLRGPTHVLASLLIALTVPEVSEATVGLQAHYYTSSAPVTTMAGALAIETQANLLATFTATSVCYPSCGTEGSDSMGLAGWLGSGATNLVYTTASTIGDLSHHTLGLYGLVTITAGGSHIFSIGSDDGSQLWIDGNLVVDNGTMHSFSSVSGNPLDLSAGDHTIRIVQYENAGSSGLTAQLDGTALSGAVLSTISAVPEPAAWMLMLVGFGAVGAALRIRRNRAIA